MKKLFIILIATTIVCSCSDVNPSKNPDAAIQFEDPVAAGICLKYFDSNNDGKISFAEAAAVGVDRSDLKVFAGANIKKFDEFKYFAGVYNLAYWDWLCCPLTHFSLPERIDLGSFRYSASYRGNSPLKRLTFTCKSVPSTDDYDQRNPMSYLYSNSSAVIYVPNSSLIEYQKALANMGFMNDRVKGY